MHMNFSFVAPQAQKSQHKAKDTHFINSRQSLSLIFSI